jgi:hypothetical protein
VGVLVVGRGVLSVKDATSWVMKASLNVGVGITVLVTTGVTNGLVGSIVAAGAELEIVGIPPSGVGVAYCPHNDVVLLPQDASKKEVVIKKLISRFTKSIRC